MVDDEAAVLVDVISGKAGVFGIERRDEFEPVAALVQIAQDLGFVEFDFFEGMVTEVEFLVDLIQGAVAFPEPFAVFIDQGGEFDVAERSAFQDEIAPVGPQLSGLRNGGRERDLAEIAVSGLMDPIE